VQTLLLIFRGTTKVTRTHDEAITLGIEEAGGAGLDVGRPLLELAEDGLIALLAVNMPE
jgi:hypothetical protein